MLWSCSYNLFSLLSSLLHISSLISSTVEIHHHDSFSRNENLEEEQQKNTLWKRVLGVNRQMLTSKA